MSGVSKENRIKISNAADFGKVAVMFGGSSSERDISLESGNAVLAALQSCEVDAIPWDPSEKNMYDFNEAGFDRVWIALHGTGGEDGTIQGALKWLNIPYTGSDVMASALAMDKIRSKRLFKEVDIETPDFLIIEKRGDAVLAAEQFGYPIILKPSNQGSSVGMSKVFEVNELGAAVDLALNFSGLALAERCIIGDEITVAVLQGQALPSICIETPRVFYDYRAKYEVNSTEYRCPGTDDPVLEVEYAKIAVAAFDVLDCSGWGRVDFITGRDGKPQVLEVNTVPGMTSHSLVPMAAKAAGIDFTELCWRILETSISDQSAITYIEQTPNDA